jgi:hypothetical protein
MNAASVSNQLLATTTPAQQRQILEIILNPVLTG